MEDDLIIFVEDTILKLSTYTMIRTNVACYNHNMIQKNMIHGNLSKAIKASVRETIKSVKFSLILNDYIKSLPVCDQLFNAFIEIIGLNDINNLYDEDRIIFFRDFINIIDNDIKRNMLVSL